MNRCTRRYDLVGRYGGEEFLVILPETGGGEAVEIAGRIRAGIESKEIEISPVKSLSVSASFGVACFGEDGTVVEDLLLKVDERLYQAKRKGRNRVVHT